MLLVGRIQLRFAGNGFYVYIFSGYINKKITGLEKVSKERALWVNRIRKFVRTLKTWN